MSVCCSCPIRICSRIRAVSCAVSIRWPHCSACSRRYGPAHWQSTRSSAAATSSTTSPRAMPTSRASSARFGKPVYCIPGNHDDPAELRRALAASAVPGWWRHRPGRVAADPAGQLRARPGGRPPEPGGAAAAGCRAGRQRPLCDDLRAPPSGFDVEPLARCRRHRQRRSAVRGARRACAGAAGQLGSCAPVFRRAPPRRAAAGDAVYRRAVPAAVSQLCDRCPTARLSPPDPARRRYPRHRGSLGRGQRRSRRSRLARASGATPRDYRDCRSNSGASNRSRAGGSSDSSNCCCSRWSSGSSSAMR